MQYIYYMFVCIRSSIRQCFARHCSLCLRRDQPVQVQRAVNRQVNNVIRPFVAIVFRLIIAFHLLMRTTSVSAADKQLLLLLLSIRHHPDRLFLSSYRVVLSRRFGYQPRQRLLLSYLLIIVWHSPSNNSTDEYLNHNK